jgi:hypothetical protein
VVPLHTETAPFGPLNARLTLGASDGPTGGASPSTPAHRHEWNVNVQNENAPVLRSPHLNLRGHAYTNWPFDTLPLGLLVRTKYKAMPRQCTHITMPHAVGPPRGVCDVRDQSLSRAPAADAWAGRAQSERAVQTRAAAAAVRPPEAAEAQAMSVEQSIEERLAAPLAAHPRLRRGQLSNGLRYVILPNPVPPNRFEAHLEVCGRRLRPRL